MKDEWHAPMNRTGKRGVSTTSFSSNHTKKIHSLVGKFAERAKSANKADFYCK